MVKSLEYWVLLQYWLSRGKMENKRMDIIRYIYNELSCFIKAYFDISLQKIASILHRNNSGL